MDIGESAGYAPNSVKLRFRMTGKGDFGERLHGEKP